ncbi:MAG: helix-hairpin-helix domain-containing protein, partial [Candidatus Nanopelagicales bacterium]
VVASLVVFEDALPKKRDYRRFVIRHGHGNDDVASVAEVVKRRFTHVDDGEQRTFKYEPGLLVIDGGRPQVTAAKQALLDIGRADIPVVGLAKRLEEIWSADQPDPVILSRSSEALYLLQRARDEAHRFALAHQVQRRAKRSAASALDDIPGLGEARKQELLRAFKSVKRIRAASADDLLALPGFGPKLVAAITEALAKPSAALPAFDASTGEILDEGRT